MRHLILCCEVCCDLAMETGYTRASYLIYQHLTCLYRDPWYKREAEHMHKISWN